MYVRGISHLRPCHGSDGARGGGCRRWPAGPADAAAAAAAAVGSDGVQGGGRGRVDDHRERELQAVGSSQELPSRRRHQLSPSSSVSSLPRLLFHHLFIHSPVTNSFTDCHIPQRHLAFLVALSIDLFFFLLLFSSSYDYCMRPLISNNLLPRYCWINFDGGLCDRSKLIQQQSPVRVMALSNWKPRPSGSPYRA